MKWRSLGGSRPRTWRRTTSVLMVFTTVALVAGLVFAAVNADGREVSRASSNDGGAWLINRELAVVGHKNRSAGELSSFLRIVDSSAADVHQAGDLVVVHDAATNRLIEVDARSFNQDLEPTQLPEFSNVVAVEGAVVVFRTEPLQVWRVDAVALATLESLDGFVPLYAGSGAGAIAARADGTIVLVDADRQLLQWYFPDGSISPAITLPIDDDVDVAEVSMVDDSAAVLLADGDLLIVGRDEVEHHVSWRDVAPGMAPLEHLQQPSGAFVDLRPASKVVGVTAQGELVEMSLGRDQVDVLQRGSLRGTNPLAPIVHQGCIYAVVTRPAVLGIACDQFVARDLVGAGQELRIRLVNGWVWVNDLEDGGTWVTNDELEVESISDWGRAERAQLDEPEPPEETGGESLAAADRVIVEDPDAVGGVRDSDDFDPTEANVPPVPTDDNARTRVDRPTVVDVLANDTDANNDILVVSSAELLAGSARVTITPSLKRVQVTPAPGYTGTVQLRYFVSDGRAEPVSAIATVEVLSDTSTNRAPEPVTDVVATAPGHATTIDVLRNDIDADGDALALVSIESETGTLRWDPSGQVTFTPDSTTAAGWLELPYVVRDDLGAEAGGLLRVEIRDRGANQEPDARNDQATTVVGRPVAIDLLANDSDPDGDPLIVGTRPQLIQPDRAEYQSSTTPDGEFVFSTQVPGTYLFSYTVNDGAEGGSESDTARIRIDVRPQVNSPPIAVRDDIVIAVGDTRTVYVLDNDGDPDGDVVSIVDWEASPDLLVAEFNDETGHVGFQITVPPNGSGRPTLTYSISDGVNDPVSAPVVVALVSQTTQDQPPFALDDVIEARVGSTIEGIAVLANDFDPEGGALRIVRIGDTGLATATVALDAQTIEITIPESVVSSFTVPYDIIDEGGNRAAAVLRVQLISPDAPNRPPIARTDDARTTKGTSVFVNVLANDSDPDSDPIALEGIAAQPDHGVAAITADGAILYEPDPEFTGTDIIRYAIVDSLGDRTVGEVFVGVVDQIGVNGPPIANDDSYVLAGTPTITPLDVLENDFDPDGDPLRVIDVTRATIGAVAIDVFGRVEFVPPPSLAEAGVATFEYVIADTAGNRAQATVSVELDAYVGVPTPTPVPDEPEPEPTPDPAVPPTPVPTPTPDPAAVNESPIAVNDERGPVKEGSRVRVTVLENDFDPDGPREELSIVSVGAGGRVDGAVVVVEVDDETVFVEYTIADRFGAESSATISVVVSENQAPVVEPLEVATSFETALALDLAGQARDADGDPLFFVCCDGIRGGAITDVETAVGEFTLVFTPDDGFAGQAGFSYLVDDQQGHQSAGSVTITVEPPENRPPVAVSDTVQVPQGVTAAVDLDALSGDPDGDEVTRKILTQPGGGIAVQIDGAFASISVERSVEVGPAGSFTYEISDGALEAVGEVVIEVIEGENDPPLVTSTTKELPAASSTTVDLGPLTIETDPGDSVIWSLAAVSFDPLIVTLNGSILQINAPAVAAGSVVDVVFEATDTRGAIAAGVITVTVVDPTAPPPAAVGDTAVTIRGAAIEVAVLANDVDPLGEGLELIDVTSNWGTAGIIGDQVRFSPGDAVGAATVNYTMRDRAKRESSATIAIEVVGPPDRPAPPAVVADSEQVTITWTNPKANGRPITGYTITAGNGQVQTVGVQNTYTWTGLTNGESYAFSVTATNSIGASEPSELSLPVVPNQVPETPAPPIVEFGDRALTLSWTAPDNAGTEITGYELEIGPASAIQAVGPGTTFEWQGLTNGQEYTFRVRAENAAGFSPFSALSAPEHPAAPPDPPTIGRTTRGGLSGSLIVTWTEPVNNGDTITKYQIRSSEGATNMVPGTATTFDWSNLTNGVEVAFQVRAKNRAGWSGWSDMSNRVPPCGLPAVPNAPTVTRGDGQVQLSWNKPANNGCQITGYTVTSGAGAIQNSTTTSHTFTGLTNGTSYTFSVRATNERGTSNPSAQSSAVIPAGPPICATGGTVSASLSAPRAIDLAWTAAIDNGSPITDYLIDSGTGFQSLGAVSASTVISNLSNGTPYSFSIKAVNSVGQSPTCGTAGATTWNVPTPVGLTVVFDPITDTLTATGSGGLTLDGAWQDGYSFELDGGSGNASNVSVHTSTGAPSGVDVPFTILEDGSFSVRLESCNAAGCVEVTNCCTDITLAERPDALESRDIDLSYDSRVSLSSQGFGTSLFVELDTPDDNGAEILHYVWEARRFGWWGEEPVTAYSGPEPYVGGNKTFFLFDHFLGLSNYPLSANQGTGVTWEFRAAAVNVEGQADWSPWESITPNVPDVDIDAFKYSGNCGLATCVRVHIDGYGLTPNSFYTARVLSATRSGDCTPQVVTDASGSFSGDYDCNFVGGDDAPNRFWVDVDGVESGQIG